MDIAALEVPYAAAKPRSAWVAASTRATEISAINGKNNNNNPRTYMLMTVGVYLTNVQRCHRKKATGPNLSPMTNISCDFIFLVPDVEFSFVPGMGSSCCQLKCVFSADFCLGTALLHCGCLCARHTCICVRSWENGVGLINLDYLKKKKKNVIFMLGWILGIGSNSARYFTHFHNLQLVSPF